MRLLKCKLCAGEIDIVGNEHSIFKKIKCKYCGFANNDEKKYPEVIVIKKKAIINA